MVKARKANAFMRHSPEDKVEGDIGALAIVPLMVVYSFECWINRECLSCRAGQVNLP